MMDRFKKIWCDPVKVLSVLIGAFLGVGLIIYVWVQATQGFDSDIETETAVLVSVNDTVDSRAYIFRDETVVGKNNSGTIVTVVSEGDRVSKGQLLANIYPNAEDTHLQDEINRIDRKIAILDESTVDSQFIVTDLDKIDGEIGDIFADIFEANAKGNISDAIDGSADLLVNLNRRDLIVDSDNDFTDEKRELLSQRTSIEARIDSSSSPVYASSSGYFYGEVDGYEEIFTVDKIENITLDSFAQLTQSRSDESAASAGAVKIINDFVWYVVCEVSSDKAALLEENQSYAITFPESRDAQISMKLVKKVGETTSPTALAVFRANVMPSSFNYKRGQSAQIVLDVAEGLAVPKKALRVIDGVNGVYILVGDVVHYRRVDIINEVDNYYIVRYGKSADAFAGENVDGTDEVPKIKQLSLYDNIIVSGKDLFDGKIVG